LLPHLTVPFPTSGVLFGLGILDVMLIVASHVTEEDLEGGEMG